MAGIWSRAVWRAVMALLERSRWRLMASDRGVALALGGPVLALGKLKQPPPLYPMECQVLTPSTLGFSTAVHGNQSWRIQNVRSGDLRRNRLSIKSLTVIVCAGDKLENVPRGLATIAFQYSFRNKVQTFIVLAQLQRNRPAQNGLGLGLVKGVSFFWGSPDNRCNTFTTWVQFSVRQ